MSAARNARTGSGKSGDDMAADRGNSLEKMLSMLDLFTEAAPIWSTDDLIRYMGNSRSTCYRYIKTLQGAGLIAAVGNGSYVLGPRLLELDRQIRLCDPLYTLAGSLLSALVEKTGHSALLCTLYSQYVMCVRVEHDGVAPEGFFDRGQKRPLFSGAASKIILAHLPIHQLKGLYLKHRKTIAAAGLGADWEGFRTRLRNIRQAGFCQTIGEFSPGIVGISSPIFNKEGKILGSIGIGASLAAFQRQNAQEIVDVVRQVAQDATSRMSETQTQLDRPARAIGRL